VLAVGLVLLILLTMRVASTGAVQMVTGGWPAGVGIVLRADALGLSFAIVSQLVLLAAAAHVRFPARGPGPSPACSPSSPLG
jgi:multicomponent Na+:H+ antiporter subunit D